MSETKKLQDKYSLGIAYTLRQRAGLDKHDTSNDDLFLKMSKEKVFKEVLEWNGLLGYDYTIKGWIETIYGVDLDSQ